MIKKTMKFRNSNRPWPFHPGEQGGALVVVMMVVFITAGLLGAALMLNQNTRNLARRSELMIQCTYASEAGLNKIYADLNTLLNMTNGESIQLSSLTSLINPSTAPTDQFPSSEFQYVNYTALPLSPEGVPIDAATNTVVDGRQYRYLAVVWVRSVQNPNVMVKLQQEIGYSYQPLCQYGIFFDQNLSIGHGANAVFSGKVHSNGKLTLSAFHGSTGTYLGPVTSVSSPLSNYYGIASMYANLGSGPVTNAASFWSNSVFQMGKSQFQVGEHPKTNMTFVFSNSLPYLVSKRILPGVTNLASGYTTNYYGAGGLATNVTSINPNASPNGAVELIQRPVLGNYNGTNYSMYGTGNSGDPFAPIQGVPADDERQVNTRIFYKAGLRVILTGSNSATHGTPKFYTGDVSDANPHGQEITAVYGVTNGTNVTFHTNAAYAILTNAFVNGQKISDYRRAGTYDSTGLQTSNLTVNGVSNVTTVDFDVSKLLDSNGNLTNGLFASTNAPYGSLGSTFNGIVYVSNIDAGSTNNRMGVKILNASKLPRNVIDNGVTNRSNLGMTVVSDNPVYLVGDFNTGDTGTNVPSNASGTNDTSTAGNLANCTAANYERLPAAIMADAVSAVSASYLSSMANQNYHDRLPVDTTINAAIIAGRNYGATSNSLAEGNGTLVRMLENWSYLNSSGTPMSRTRKLVINGSMISIFASEQAMDQSYASPYNVSGISGFNPSYFPQYYQPPVRVWSYDPNFNDPSKLPPGTPRIRVFSQGQWAKVE